MHGLSRDTEVTASGVSKPRRRRTVVVLPEPDSRRVRGCCLRPPRTRRRRPREVRLRRHGTSSRRRRDLHGGAGGGRCAVGPAPPGTGRARARGRRRGALRRTRTAARRTPPPPAPPLDHAVAQHDEVVGAFGREREVVRDEEQADPEGRPQVGEQVGMRFWIVTSRALVGSSATSSAGSGYREPDQHALEHPPGQLMRVRAVHSAPDRRAHAVETSTMAAAAARGIPLAGEGGRLLRLAAMVLTGLRAEAGSCGTNPRDGVPARGGSGREGQPSTSSPSRRTRPSGVTGVAREEPQHGLRDGRLARAGLADEGEAPAAVQIERDVGDDPTAAVRHRQVAHGEEGVRHGSVLRSQPAADAVDRQHHDDDDRRGA